MQNRFDSSDFGQSQSLSNDPEDLTKSGLHNNKIMLSVFYFNYKDNQ